MNSSMQHSMHAANPMRTSACTDDSDIETGRNCPLKFLIAAVSQAVSFLIGIVEASLRLDDLIPLQANTIKVGKECARLPVASREDLVQS